jgi:hypothetical protein
MEQYWARCSNLSQIICDPDKPYSPAKLPPANLLLSIEPHVGRVSNHMLVEYRSTYTHVVESVKVCLINSCLHRKHMSFRPELIKSQCLPLHRCCAQFRFSSQLMLHWNHMVISTKRLESLNCAYHLWLHLLYKIHACCGKCGWPYNSLLHRNHIMVFGPELLGHRHSSQHATWALNYNGFSLNNVH